MSGLADAEVDELSTWDSGFYSCACVEHTCPSLPCNNHRDLNVRQGKADRGSAYTNRIDPEGFGGSTGICTACLFGCAE